MLDPSFIKYAETVTVDEVIQRAAKTDNYQIRIYITYFFVFMFSAFIQMGFPFIFQPAQLECPPGETCDLSKLCESGNYVLSDKIKSVAYTFELVCARAPVLKNCFTAFLCGGFIGSIYYGQFLERKGRRAAVLETMTVMIIGLVLSMLAGHVVLFELGVFLVSAGFRGFHNAALLSLYEVMSEVSRASPPMVLSVGWALGQIIVACLAIWVINWRTLFLLTLIPLVILLYYAYIYTKESPRFLAAKKEFDSAKRVLQEIALINDSPISGFILQGQKDLQDKMRGFQEVIEGNQVFFRMKHHSYASLFKFKSVRIRVLALAAIWSTISLSYFMSVNASINPTRGLSSNIALAGTIEIVAYFFSIISSLKYDRLYVIKLLLKWSIVVHLLFYFVGPLQSYTGFSKLVVMTLDIGVRILMSVGNSFIAIYSLELFATSIRHFAFGMLGFITKLMYLLSFVFEHFWSARHINPNFMVGVLFIGCYLLTPWLRETKDKPFKDNLSEDNDSLMMQLTVSEPV